MLSNQFDWGQFGDGVVDKLPSFVSNEIAIVLGVSWTFSRETEWLANPRQLLARLDLAQPAPLRRRRLPP